MSKLFRLSLAKDVWAQGFLFGLTVLLSFGSASAQVTALGRQLDRLDLGVGGTYTLTKSVSGTNYLSDPVNLSASSTLGALVQIRYTKSPLLGLEFNYTYARYTQQFSVAPGGVQANASEYSLGYLAHLPNIFGVQPFAAVGAGATAFTPTKLGGQGGLYERARATYYYDIGVDDQFSKYFGVRAQFRQTFYKAPDFGANYLTINQQTFTSEPSVGFYVKF
jgi:hypothetical protein